MDKRGQVTIFIILGFVILILIILILSLRDVGYGISPQKYLDNKINIIQDDVKSCVESYAKTALINMGNQGGSINPGKYVLYEGRKVQYLCSAIPGSVQCLNLMPSNKNIEKELDNFLNTNVPDCIDINKFKEQYSFPEIKIEKSFQAVSSINKTNVVIKVSYPITLVKGTTQVSLSDITETIDIPLGQLLDTTYDIIDSEARTGTFFNLQYMLANRGEVEIYKDTPYPDKVYVLNARDSDYKFYFAIEGAL
ncbi:MAG: hypothetical protein PHD81_00960 [Candidatus Nanoarchaeia archaeon]|nr:hypothetical protein [Candidatus Nanoarchaeia archaeon]MDD5587660.1 hypothetical protein [Candidatus Nanoarchaeia archaeon]